MSEVRPIPFAPGYFVSDKGKVYSERLGARRRILGSNRGGYRRHVFYGCTVSTHRLVALMFIGPQYFPWLEVRHLDGNPSNNRVDNLAWSTHKENMTDMPRHGRGWIGKVGQQGSKNGASILNEKQVLEIKRRLVNGETRKSVALRFGIRTWVIGYIARGHTWRHVQL